MICTIFDHALPQDSFCEFIIDGKTCILVLELVRVRRYASFVLNYHGNDNFKPSRYLKVELCITPSILLRRWAVAEQRPTFPALPHAVGVVSFNTGTADVGFHSNVEGLDQGSMTWLQ